MSERLTALLTRHEGMRLKPYIDTQGKLTIGVGRNLDDMGITEEEAKHLLQNDIARVTAEADRELDWYSKLDWQRQDVILSMLINMGVTRFRGFQKMIAALESGNYAVAADEMMDSAWAKQVPSRAKELSDMMRLGAQDE